MLLFIWLYKELQGILWLFVGGACVSSFPEMGRMCQLRSFILQHICKFSAETELCEDELPIPEENRQPLVKHFKVIYLSDFCFLREAF